jgi:Flp pilus assembly protein TadG
MLCRPHSSDRIRTEPRAAATVELALVLPLLSFVFVVGADFSRVFYYSQMLTEAAHKGAQFASNPDLAARLPYETAEDAALADLATLTPQPTAQVEFSDDDLVPTARVTVTYQFQPICRHFGLTTSVRLARSAQLRLHPSADLPEDGEP